MTELEEVTGGGGERAEEAFEASLAPLTVPMNNKGNQIRYSGVSRDRENQIGCDRIDGLRRSFVLAPKLGF